MIEPAMQQGVSVVKKIDTPFLMQKNKSIMTMPLLFYAGDGT